MTREEMEPRHHREHSDRFLYDATRRTPPRSVTTFQALHWLERRSIDRMTRQADIEQEEQ